MMKKTRNLVSIILILCLITTLLTACGEKQVENHGLDSDAPTTITIWHYYNGVQQENFEKLLLQFNETVGREMGIIVKGYSKESINDLASAVLASLREDPGAETAPDMFAAYAGTAFSADALGRVADLSAYFTDEELSEYVEGYLEEGNIDGTGSLKIFPIAKSTEVLMLNQTDWQTFADAENVSIDDLSTWESLAQVAEKYYNYTDSLTPDTADDGKAFFGRDSIANYMLVGAKQLGLEFCTLENGNVSVHLDEDVVRQLWDNYYVPYVKGYYFSSQARFRSDDTQTGSIIAMACSTTGAMYFPATVTLDDDHSYPIESLTLPIPNFTDTDPYVVQQGAGMVVVKSDETKEYACSVFLKWFTEEERSIDFSVSSGYMPVKKTANDSKAFAAAFEAEPSILQSVMEVAASEVNNYQLYAPKPYDTAEDVRSFLDRYIQETAQEAHDTAAERISNGEAKNTVLADYLSDAAFQTWYEGFVSGLQAAAKAQEG